MNAPLDFLPIFELFDIHDGAALNTLKAEPSYLNESAEFLLNKVTWDKVIESGVCTEFGAADLSPTLPPLPEAFSTALSAHAALKRTANPGASAAFYGFNASPMTRPEHLGG